MRFWERMLGGERKWREAASRLGLALDEHGHLTGQWGPIPVRAAHTFDWEEDDEGNAYRTNWRTEYVATLAPPLRMGLYVVPRSLFGGALKDVFGGDADDIPVAHRGLDERMRIYGLDADHVQRLLSGDVAATLEAAHLAEKAIEITDTAVTITHDGCESDADDIGRALSWSGRVAAALVTARPGVLARWEYAIRNSWPGVGARLGLRFDPDAAALLGAVAGCRVRAQVEAHEQSFFTAVYATLPSPLGLSLQISKAQSGLLGSLFRGQDIEVGHPFFDDRFVIKGEPEDEVRRVLDAEVVARLADLFARAPQVQVTDHHVAVKVVGVASAPEAIGHMIEATAAAASAMHHRGPAPTGYRG